MCGTSIVSITDKYVYLGLTLTEFLDYSVMAKIVSQSASRALGLLIAKYKSLGAMQLNVFRKLSVRIDGLGNYCIRSCYLGYPEILMYRCYS